MFLSIAVLLVFLMRAFGNWFVQGRIWLFFYYYKLLLFETQLWRFIFLGVGYDRWVLRKAFGFSWFAAGAAFFGGWLRSPGTSESRRLSSVCGWRRIQKEKQEPPGVPAPHSALAFPFVPGL